MIKTHCYGLRRLSPFQGTLQIIELPEGRAFSLDGEHWTVQLLSPNTVREQVWGNIGPTRAKRRFFSYARWSAKDRLRRVPIDPTLGDQSRHPALQPLINALEQVPEVPFPLADELELWLLDQEGMPLALVRSQKRDLPPLTPRFIHWEPLPINDPGFYSPRLLNAVEHRGLQRDRQGHLEMLVRVIANCAGPAPQAQWFHRDGAGNGEGLSGWQLDPALEGRRLNQAAFPELLLRERWSKSQEGLLVQHYLEWQAPVLLTLTHLSWKRRQRLEKAAARRPLALYQYRKLIPEFVDRAVVAPALVEAVLRQSVSRSGAPRPAVNTSW